MEKNIKWYKRNQILQELKHIGYNIEYIGTKYLLETILELYRNRDLMLDNLQQNIINRYII